MTLGAFLGLPWASPSVSSARPGIATRLGLAPRARRTRRWTQMLAASLMAGIGFTMSLFIGNLGLGSSPRARGSSEARCARGVASSRPRSASASSYLKSPADARRRENDDCPSSSTSRASREVTASIPAAPRDACSAGRSPIST